MTEKRNIKGSEAFLLSLLEEGVDTIFGYPGGAIMPLYDELYDYTDGIRHILVRHEQGAVHAAQGYARTCGRPGVCMATAGPGATNFVTGIADAMLDSTPLVCITAQVGTENLGSNFFQEADMINITLPITKWSYQITKAEEIPSVVAKAFHIASSGKPGPVVISFTKNAQVEMTDFVYDREKFLENVTRPLPKPSAGPSGDLAATVASMINDSERPLILAGHGVIISGAADALRELAEKSGAPVATTLLGLSCMPTDHPLYVGNAGMHGHLAPNRMTQKADLIVAVGTRFSDRTTGVPAGYAPQAKIVHIEIDPTEIGRNVRADVAVNSDARMALEAILSAGIKYRERTQWLAFAAECAKEEDAVIRHRDFDGEVSGLGAAEAKDWIRMGQAVDAVARYADPDAVIVSDVGQNQMFAARYSRFGEKGRWVTSGGLGTMGFGLPASVGAKIAAPGRQVIVFLGDGGLQMTIQELGTIHQTGAAVKIILLDNTYLGMVRQWQELFYDRRYSFTHLVNPDFVSLVESYGIRAARVTERGRLDEAVRELLECDGPAFLDVATDPGENVFPMVPAGASLDSIITGKEMSF